MTEQIRQSKSRGRSSELDARAWRYGEAQLGRRALVWSRCFIGLLRLSWPLRGQTSRSSASLLAVVVGSFLSADAYRFLLLRYER